MKRQQLIESLLYLDNGYISDFYEVKTGYAPETKITKTDGINASVKIPIFGGGASSTESRAYTISTRQMLVDVFDRLDDYSPFQRGEMGFGAAPIIRWVEGSLSLYTMRVKRKEYSITLLGKPPAKSKKAPKDENPVTDKVVGEETYFAICCANGEKFALLPNPDYFLDALDTIPKLLGVVVDRIDIPVRALIKIFPAASAVGEWISCPLVMVARQNSISGTAPAIEPS